jgi:hypothetical protein
MKVKTFILVLMTAFLILASGGNFQAQDTREFFVVSISKVGNGSGHVYSSPPGIDCGDVSNDCTATFRRGTVVSLRPRAGSGGSMFHAWSVVYGSTIRCPATRGVCNFIVMEDSSAQAEFVLD